MPVSTSPYQQNDYQAASAYRPYRLPTNDILRGLSAEDQFWDDGARRVRAYYDNALNLDLTLDENKQIRKDFMAKADDQMAKLSTMNLADPSVQKQGLDVFKPLFQDQGILLDDAITKKRNQVIGDAMRAKNDQKTQGEGYNQDNLTYALQGFKNFGNATSRGSLKDIYGQTANAEYTPYHDVSKEYLDLASKCKPDKMDVNRVDGLYLHDISDESMTADKMNGCIKGGLSDKAWNQLKITGSVRYGQNYGAIANGYAPILESANKGYADNLVTLAAERDKRSKSKDWNDEMAQAYDDQEKQIKSTIANNHAQIGRMRAGDFSDIQKNYDNIISQVYGNQDIGSFAHAFSYMDRTDKYSPNAAGIAQFNQSNENARFGANLKFQQEKTGAELGMKQQELELKKQENDVNLLKAFMSGTGTSARSGAGGASYQMLSSIYQRLGLPMDLAIMPHLDNGTLVPAANLGKSVDDVNDKANQFHHERIETAQGIYNSLKEIGVPDAALKSLYNKQGQLVLDAAYDMADKYLTTFHQTAKDNNGNPINNAYAGKVDQITELENLTNKYSNARSNVYQFMKMRDDINKRLDAHPEIKQALNQSDTKINDFFTKGEGSKLAMVMYDQGLGQAVAITPDRMQKIVKGNDDQYTLQGGQVVRKGTNVPLDQYDIYNGKVLHGDKANNTEGQAQALAMRLQEQGYQIGEHYLGGHIEGWGQLAQRKGGTRFMTNNNMAMAQKLLNERAQNITPMVNSTIQDVVRNQNVYGVGNVPGLGVSMKQQFAGVVPKFQDDNYQFRPGNAFQDAQGNTVATVEVFRRREKAADKTDPDNFQDSWEPVSSEDVMKDLAAHNYPTGGSNDINYVNGQLTVKTPYLPIAEKNNPLKAAVENQLYASKQLRLGYNEKASNEVKWIPGSSGFKIGFDVVGQGSTYSGDRNPSQFRTWFRTPTGDKEYFGDPMFADNQVVNNLSLLEQRMPAITDAYLKRKNSH